MQNIWVQFTKLNPQEEYYPHVFSVIPKCFPAPHFHED
ncbi:MAG: hypothetical protein JETT_1832 [Candidatus Jettenia ecosi]|uniref:Uncharacterized protein n=1 Tax=Candidatus Jettenia ecosi TaxID=2494326 RepID=A0A533QGU8_9BACT|nr:MAG: hypothetical protein JETT_1832 [Candidatus Jettenia ecosi]